MHEGVLYHLSRIAHWNHLAVNALLDSRIYTMKQSNSSTYEFRYLHRVIRVYVSEIVQFRFTSLVYDSYSQGIHHFPAYKIVWTI